MTVFALIRACEDIFFGLYYSISPVMEFLANEYFVLGQTWSILDLVFGAGIGVVLGATMIKWLVGIIT